MCVLLMGYGYIFCSKANLLVCCEIRPAALFMDRGMMVQLKGACSYTDGKPRFQVIAMCSINWTVKVLVD